MATKATTKQKNSAERKNRREQRGQQAQGRQVQGVNAMELLEQDHREVEELFDQFDELENDSEKQEMAQKICMMLTVHAQIEEEIFYPAARKATGDAELLDEALVEHAGAKRLVSEIEEMEAGEELFDAKVKVLGEQIKHHIREEEEELFPELESSKKMDFQVVGAQLMKRKEELLKEMEAA